MPPVRRVGLREPIREPTSSKHEASPENPNAAQRRAESSRRFRGEATEDASTRLLAGRQVGDTRHVGEAASSPAIGSVTSALRMHLIGEPAIGSGMWRVQASRHHRASWDGERRSAKCVSRGAFCADERVDGLGRPDRPRQGIGWSGTGADDTMRALLSDQEPQSCRATPTVPQKSWICSTC